MNDAHVYAIFCAATGSSRTEDVIAAYLVAADAYEESHAPGDGMARQLKEDAAQRMLGNEMQAKECESCEWERLKYYLLGNAIYGKFASAVASAAYEGGNYYVDTDSIIVGGQTKDVR